ncbi:hypothetical protein THAOC_19729, partial [Thalassiosira oceanica]
MRAAPQQQCDDRPIPVDPPAKRATSWRTSSLTRGGVRGVGSEVQSEAPSVTLGFNAMVSAAQSDRRSIDEQEGRLFSGPRASGPRAGRPPGLANATPEHKPHETSGRGTCEHVQALSSLTRLAPPTPTVAEAETLDMLRSILRPRLGGKQRFKRHQVNQTSRRRRVTARRPAQRRPVDFSPRRKDSLRFYINPIREAKFAVDPQRLDLSGSIGSVEGVSDSGGSTPIGSAEGVSDSGGSISSGSGGLICGLIYGGFIRGGDVLSGGVSIVGGSICGGSICGDWIGSVKGDSNSGLSNRGVRLSNDCGAQHRLEI